jgi:hypothetical protein
VHISAFVKNARATHSVSVATGGSTKSLAVRSREGGFGSSINGGEFLMLALATCYCNDLYREAARLGIGVESVEVEASADFDGVGWRRGISAIGHEWCPPPPTRTCPGCFTKRTRLGKFTIPCAPVCP